MMAHTMTGDNAQPCTTIDHGLDLIAERTGIPRAELYVGSTGYVFRWSYRCAGEVVGRIG